MHRIGKLKSNDKLKSLNSINDIFEMYVTNKLKEVGDKWNFFVVSLWNEKVHSEFLPVNYNFLIMISPDRAKIKLPQNYSWPIDITLIYK